jgi:hypothetical protein
MPLFGVRYDYYATKRWYAGVHAEFFDISPHFSPGSWEQAQDGTRLSYQGTRSSEGSSIW